MKNTSEELDDSKLIDMPGKKKIPNPKQNQPSLIDNLFLNS